MPGTASLQILDQSENQALDTCATCPSLCRWSCPVAEAEARETTSPHRLAVLAGLLKREKISTQQVDGTLYHCTYCLACTSACVHDNDVGLIMSLGRARLLDNLAAPEGIGQVCGQFALAGNAAGRPLDEALSIAAETAGQSVVAVSDRVYWPGCQVLAHAPANATDALRALALSGMGPVAVVSASAGCCGLPLFWAGELDGFRAHALRFAAELSDVEEVVAHDPTCAHAVNVRYKQLGIEFRPRVVSVVGAIAKSWPAAQGTHAPHAYLDGCVQARGLRELDPPRALIEKATRQAAVELPGLRRAESDCCGGQGLLPVLVPQTARAMAQARIDAFLATGAERLLTASPRCRTHLKAVDPSLPIEDLVGWLAGR